MKRVTGLGVLGGQQPNFAMPRMSVLAGATSMIRAPARRSILSRMNTLGSPPAGRASQGADATDEGFLEEVPLPSQMPAADLLAMPIPATHEIHRMAFDVSNYMLQTCCNGVYSKRPTLKTHMISTAP